METTQAISPGGEFPLTQMTYEGRLGQLYLIWLTNFFLTILTLGIYRFWGKVRIRKYLLRNVSLLGDRFEYTGRGKELFIGFLKALPLLLAIFVPINVYPAQQHPWVSVCFIGLYYLVRLGIYTAMRYRLSHSTWRGIRGSLQGSAFTYANRAMGYAVINLLTLGIAIPFTNIKLMRYMVEHMHFGSSPAKFEGTAKALFSSHYITLLLFIPTLGISRIWYKAKFYSHCFNATTVDSVRLVGYFTGGKLFRRVCGNFFILIVTLGCGVPIVLQRNVRFFVQNVAIYGHLRSDQLLQSQDQVPISGEGLDGFLGDFIA
jgi:uncharacterized membrane protein YjgN (DUF898 family)